MAKSHPPSFSDMKQLGANYLPSVIKNPKEIRLVIVWIILLLGGLGLSWNLFRLQVIQRPFLERYAKQQQEITLRPFVPRRSIIDRNNNLLAIDRPVYTLYAHPKIFRRQTKEQIANQLAPLIGLSATELLTKFNSAPSGIRVKDKITQEIADKITAMRQDGLELNQNYSRLYPTQETAGDIVGYVDDNHKGQAGLEYSRETLLERSLKVLRLNRAGNGAVMPDYAPQGFNIDDTRLKLTIDVRLQRAARAALKTKMAEFKAKRGVVIIMDVRDGSLLALVAEPTYNPNQFFKYDKSLYKNWAITDLYEPGSTFKPINVAIALENKSIQPNSVFHDAGAIKVSNKVIRNAGGAGHGTINVTQIIQYSSNVGMVQVMQTLKPSIYYSWLKRLGVGASVESDLPFRASSKLKPEWIFTRSPIEPATAAFGQGFSITPLHLVRMTAALANGGKLVTPHVVQGLYNSKDELTWQPTLSPPKAVFSTNTAKTVIEMMETVVEKGTGKAAKIPDYRIAGKTGTAQKASPKGGYSEAKVTSFLAILPLESPKYIVAAVVDEPKGGSGGAVAAPVVKSVMQSLINIEKIPPSNLKVLEASESKGRSAEDAID